MRFKLVVAVSLLCVFGGWVPSSAQTTSAELRGSVVDPVGAAVVGAAVTATNESTSATRTTTTNEAGAFVFAGLVPGTYGLTVESPGFVTARLTTIALSGNERRGLGSIALQIEGVTEIVAVDAAGAVVRTASSETVGTIGSLQLSSLGNQGRDPISLLKVLPGVSITNTPDALGGNFGTATPNISGTRNDMNNVTLDGQVGQDNDIAGTFNGITSLMRSPK